jgi:hypothetical protein
LLQSRGYREEIIGTTVLFSNALLSRRIAEWGILGIFQRTTFFLLRKGAAPANVNKSFGFMGGFRTLWLSSLIATRPPQMHIEAAFEVLHSGRFSGNFSSSHSGSFGDETNSIEFYSTFSYTRGISSTLICSV